MRTLRKAQDRGHADHGWLNSHHTFSFADYHDPRFMGFGVLRVINDDTVAPGAGFPPHGHRDMEILSYVLEGELQHQDSMGNGSVIRPGELQRMSAGTGVTHSEYNASADAPVHFLQIWVLPRAPGLPFGYEQRQFPEAEKRGRLRLVASPDGAQGSLRIQQDVQVFAALVGRSEQIDYAFAKGHKGWLHVARGTVEVNGETLSAGDGLAIEGQERLEIGSGSAGSEGELLLFDMPTR